MNQHATQPDSWGWPTPERALGLHRPPHKGILFEKLWLILSYKVLVSGFLRNLLKQSHSFLKLRLTKMFLISYCLPKMLPSDEEAPSSAGNPCVPILKANDESWTYPLALAFAILASLIPPNENHLPDLRNRQLAGTMMDGLQQHLPSLRFDVFKISMVPVSRADGHIAALFTH